MDVDINVQLHLKVFILYYDQVSLSCVCITVKPGVCPRRFFGARLCAELCSCSHDSDCPNDEKCCSNGCGHQCMPPYAVIWFLSCVFITEKPGVCPSENLGEGLCVEMCSHDSNCPNDQKCCSNGCGHQCMPPYRGIYMILMCGAIFLFIYFSNAVRHLVIRFRSRVCITEKPGMCPSENLGVGVRAESCSLDRECPNDEKCCSNGCGQRCMALYKGMLN
uniref:WAP domain-containing protein n=1 Tax=Sinocyclocheilus anshuiensis TaxID=1608454 RepID=A0A671L9W6_9TELE